MIHCANPLYNVLEWSCFIGWWLVCYNPMKKWFFQSVPFFLFDITFFSVHLYIIKKNCGTPHNITINPPYKPTTKKKNYLWIITTWNRWYNIGIIPHRDYINHSSIISKDNSNHKTIYEHMNE